MKIHLYSLLIFFFGGASAYVLTSSQSSAKLTPYSPSPPRSGGAAAMGLGDRTGGPLSGGATCNDCHGNGAFTPTITLAILDGGSNPVTEYIPGDTYTLRYVVTSSSGNPAGYGMQSVGLTNANGAAGTLINPSTANTQIVNLAGKQYLEHDGISSTGVFQTNWTAPSIGTGNVSFYAKGIAVNGNFATIGDNVTSNFSLTITEQGVTSITYSSSSYCDDEPNPVPVQSGETGGAYSSSPGLILNTSTGEIDLANSTPGTYTIDYVYSNGSVNSTVSINPTYNESFSATICANETFSFGNQNLDANDAGLNVQTFQTVEGCDSIVNLTLTVNPIDLQVTLNGGVLTANQVGGTYQWVDCDNGNAIIPGETNATFAPSTSGNYAVEVTFGSCSGTSACNQISFAAICYLQHLRPCLADGQELPRR